MYCRLDGSLHVAEWQRPRQFFHSLPDCSGWPAGHCPAGSQLSFPVADRRPGQRCGRLTTSTAVTLSLLLTVPVDASRLNALSTPASAFLHFINWMNWRGSIVSGTNLSLLFVFLSKLTRLCNDHFLYQLWSFQQRSHQSEGRCFCKEEPNYYSEIWMLMVKYAKYVLAFIIIIVVVITFYYYYYYYYDIVRPVTLFSLVQVWGSDVKLFTVSEVIFNIQKSFQLIFCFLVPNPQSADQYRSNGHFVHGRSKPKKKEFIVFFI